MSFSTYNINFAMNKDIYFTENCFLFFFRLYIAPFRSISFLDFATLAVPSTILCAFKNK